MAPLRFLVSMLAAAAVSHWFPAPTVEPPRTAWYAAVSSLRDPVPESPVILVIETGPAAARETLPSQMWEEILLTMLEMKPERLLLRDRMEGSETPVRMTADAQREIERRFDEEFALVDRNIATLFDGIRLGSIGPRDSARYVAELRSLLAGGKERLIAEVLREETPEPFSADHYLPAFGAGHSGFELSDVGIALPSLEHAQPVILRPQRTDGTLPFRRLDYSAILRYQDSSRELTSLLVTMERTGYFDTVDPADRPVAALDRVLSIRRELQAEPGIETAVRWRASFDRYLWTVGTLLEGGVEPSLLHGFDELIEYGALGEPGAARVRGMKRAVVSSFAAARESFVEVLALRAELSDAIRGSFVVFGDGPGETRPADDVWQDPTDAELQAAIVNSATSGAYVVAPAGRRRLVGGLVAGFLLALFLSPWRPVVAGLLGAAAAPLLVAAALLLFVRGDIWLDPGLVLALLGSCVAASVVSGVILKARLHRLLSGSISTRLPRSIRRKLAARGRLPSRAASAGVGAIVAIRLARVTSPPGTREPVDRSRVLREFHRDSCRQIRNTGGVVLGADGWVVYAGFGTPLDPVAGEPEAGLKGACARAVEFVASTSMSGDDRRFGIDIGELLYVLSPIGGYGATGQPLLLAGRLSGLTVKYECRTLVSRHVVAETGEEWVTLRRGEVAETKHGETYPFFELIGRARS